MPFRISKSSRLWIAVLVAGLFCGVVGIWKDGWRSPADSIGLAVWLLLALCIALVIRRENE